MSAIIDRAVVESELVDLVASCYHDPLRWARVMYFWGEPGPLEKFSGPDVWQSAFLADVGREVRAKAFNGRDAVMPVRRAVSSGHGVGKSVVVAMLVHWLMATRPHAQGVVTANTSTQLETKTWATIQAWLKRCLVGHWFVINSARMYHPSFKESWFCTPQTCKEENSEAFAGQHAAGSSSFYLFDEASAIPDVIWQVAEGGLTDGEPFHFAFGNATRSDGAFHRAAFGSDRHRWAPICVDGRTSAFTNKQLIDEWAQTYGEDSDFFRVRVLGLPPSASDLQFISTAMVSAAQTRQVTPLADDPLVCGLDMARGGSDECKFRFRRGPDARSIPPITVPGERARDSMLLVSLACEVLDKSYDGRKVAALFVDATGGSIGGPVADRLRQMGREHVFDVQFGGESPDPKYANMRACMWGRMRDWLKDRGAIDKSAALETDLTGPGFHHDKRDRILLESKEDMKKRGLDSPDDGDALGLTFAQTIVAPAKPVRPYVPQSRWN